MEMNPTFQAHVTLHITLSQWETQGGTRWGQAAIDTENPKSVVFQWLTGFSCTEMSWHILEML